MGGVAPSHRWAVVLATVGALLVAGFVTFAVLTAAPPIAANLASSVSDGVAPAELAAAEMRAAVVVPAGWVVMREGDGAIVALTPDGVMKVRISLISGTARAVVDGHAGTAGEPRHEELASGVEIVHADLDAGGIVAAVQVADGVVELSSELTRDVDPAAYRPAFAELIEGVRP